MIISNNSRRNQKGEKYVFVVGNNTLRHWWIEIRKLRVGTITVFSEMIFEKCRKLSPIRLSDVQGQNFRKSRTKTNIYI